MALEARICPVCQQKLSPKLTRCVYCQTPLAPVEEIALPAGAAPLPGQAAPVRKRAFSEKFVVGVVLAGVIVACLGAVAYHLVLRSRIAADKARIEEAGGQVSDVAILAEAFAAVKANDYERFEKVTTTTAEFIVELNYQLVGDMHKGATGRNLDSSQLMQRFEYAKEVIGPNERKAQKQWFEKAVAGGPEHEQIDFRSARFVGVGALVGRESVPLIGDKSLQVRFYSLRIKTPSGTIDTHNLVPKFAVVDSRGGPKLLGLRFTAVPPP